MGQAVAVKRLGIDLGGTKTELVLIDGEHRVCWRKRVPSAALPTADRCEGDLDRAYEQTLTIIAGLLSDVTAAFPDVRSLPVGVGTPGSESVRGLLRNCNSVWLNGRSLRRDLEKRLQRPVRLANDANCFALAEAHMGAARGAHSVFGVILGTGVGGGLVFDGKLHTGANHIAGEWGHNRLSQPLPVAERGADEIDEVLQSRPCYCGRFNCLETWLSGPGLSQGYPVAGGERHPAPVIIQKMREGDALAQTLWQQYIQQLARSLAQVINVVDPEVIVLGGGLSNIEEIYSQTPLFWKPYIFSEEVRTRLLRAELGDSAGVFGAAWLW